MRLMSLVAALALSGLAACDIPPEQQARDVCTALCDCLTGSPAQLENCIVDDCLPALPAAVPPDCLTCVYENSASCSSLFSDCVTLCGL